MPLVIVGVNMNKVSLAEAGDGSPPFWSIVQIYGSLLSSFEE